MNCLALQLGHSERTLKFQKPYRSYQCTFIIALPTLCYKRTLKRGAMKTNTAKAFGRAIRNRRKELGYTQAQVAAFSGCSAPFLSALENGKPTAELERSLRVACTLGLDTFVVNREEGPL